jgi:hypothetical protein
VRREPWSADAAEHLEAFRAEVDAPVDVDAAWARFEEAVAPASTRRGTPRVWVAAAVLVAALAVAWFAIPTEDVALEQDGAGHQAQDEAVEPSTTVRSVPAPRPAQRRSVPAEPDLDIQASSAAPEDTEGPTEPLVPRRRPPRSPTDDETDDETEQEVEDETATVEPGPSRLAEELRLLEAMRAASKAGRHTEALERVRTHAREFGSGPFAAERELTRVRALCGLGRLDAMRTAKARFAAAFPSSHLGSLVRAACEEPSSPGAAKGAAKKDHDE